MTDAAVALVVERHLADEHRLEVDPLELAAVGPAACIAGPASAGLERGEQ